MAQFWQMFGESEVWRLLVEALVIPYLLAGEGFGLIRLLEWVKRVAKLKDKTILTIPVMRVVAALASVLAALAVMFVDNAITGNLADPGVFVAAVAGFLGFSQVWYKRLSPVVGQVGQSWSG